MILRKPYAILIKNFRLIHIIITICMGYLVYKSYVIFDYIQSFMKTSMLAVGEDITASLFNNFMFILPGIIIVGVLILLVVMIRKKKPFIFYVFIIGVSIGSIWGYSYLLSVLDYIEQHIIAIKDIQLAHDICLILLGCQGTCLVFAGIRALGFDIKKFDFGKDLSDLEISEEDREEFEVNVNVETNVIKRELNRRFRYAKYVYLENKLLINSVVLISLSLIFYLIYQQSTIYNVTYNVGDVFSVDDFDMGIQRVYVTQRDYNNIQITDDDKYLVIVDLQIRAHSKDLVLNTGKTILEMNGIDFYPTSVEYRNSIIDLGTTYYDEELDISFQDILLVYQVSKDNLKHTFTFKYLNDISAGKSKDNPKYVKVTSKPLFIDTVDEYYDVNVGDTVTLNENNLGSTTLTINSFELQKEFIINYNFCVKSECFDSIEYVKAPLDKNYDQALLKINAVLEKDPDEDMKDLYTALDLINYYGTLEYKVGDTTYKTNKGFVSVSPSRVSSDDIYYVSVDEKVLSADEVYLNLSIRSKNYKYKIK